MTPSLESGEHWGCGPLSFHFQNFLTGFWNPKSKDVQVCEHFGGVLVVCETGKGAELPPIDVEYKQAPLAIRPGMQL
jgi:hypothetical protein